VLPDKEARIWLNGTIEALEINILGFPLEMIVLPEMVTAELKGTVVEAPITMLVAPVVAEGIKIRVAPMLEAIASAEEPRLLIGWLILAGDVPELGDGFAFGDGPGFGDGPTLGSYPAF